MPRTKCTAADLAREVNLDLDTALILLMDARIPVEDGRDRVPRSMVSRARRALGLQSPKEKRSISALALKASMPEETVREALSRLGILRSGLESRVARHKRKDAERALEGVKNVSRVTTSLPTATPATIPLPKRARVKKPKRLGFQWHIVGKPERTSLLSANIVEAIHWKLVHDFSKSRDPIDPPGVRDRALLESAVFRPQTSLGEEDKYPTVSMAGAALFHALVHNHPFHNGNKRTALVSLVVFLDCHGYVLRLTEDQLYDYVLQLSSHTIIHGYSVEKSDEEVLEVAKWLHRFAHRVERGERPLKFRELRWILRGHGCEIENVAGSAVRIRRGSLYTNIHYDDEGREVDAPTIKKVRHDLHLDEEHGCDSHIFYNAESRIDSFIMKYRGLLQRLAKV
jgi:death-on-curing family protein